MSAGAATPWPDGRAAAVSVTFDNLGEAAELELGAHSGEALGSHRSVTHSLPIVLELLEQAGLEATFFVEGLNAELYPAALAGIAAAGHELAYHAWRHEEWSALGEEQEALNLDRGVAALRSIGVEPVGFRPPGGLVGERTAALLAERGFAYCSPAGHAPGLLDAVAVLPFEWENVDAFHVLPPFESLRERKTGSPEAGGPEGVRDALTGALEGAQHGSHTVLVLHTWLIELERDAVAEVLARVRAAADRGDLWAAPCDAVASRIAEQPEAFAEPPRLDTASWLA